MTNITFQSVHFELSRELEDFVNEKVAKLFEQDDSIIRADVILREEASSNPKNKLCEIQLSVPGENHFIKKNSESFEKSVLTAIAGLQKILRRKKTKKLIFRRKS